MNKSIKLLLVVIFLGLVLAGLTVILCLLDPTFTSSNLIIALLLTLWAFFIIPSILYSISLAKTHANNTDATRSFRIGWLWGDLIFLAIIIAAPVGGVLWFIKTIKSLVSENKN